MICVADRLLKLALPFIVCCLTLSPSLARTPFGEGKDSRIVINEEDIATHTAETTHFNKQILQPSFSWAPDRKLKWEDFMGPVDAADERTAAATHCGIGFESEHDGTGQPVSIKVFNKFFPGTSWVKPGELKSCILAHEQCHFDICELYTRILRKKLNEAVAAKDVNVAVLKDIYNKVQEDYATFQEMYEQETAHGTIANAQLMWEYKIAEALKTTEI